MAAARKALAKMSAESYNFTSPLHQSNCVTSKTTGRGRAEEFASA
jgi:hypothetical protein